MAPPLFTQRMPLQGLETQEPESEAQDVFTLAAPKPSHPLPFPPSRMASPKLVMEEAPESYKDVTAVVDTCHDAGISKKAVKLRPIGVVKG